MFIRYFPGSNTPKGFFSYYKYIMPQEKANSIFSIKGGPGVGKSSFMRGIANEADKKGYTVEVFHCSADINSIDAVVIKELNIAMYDGTAPHIMDPINPAAVDSILNFGEYWNEEEIKKHKDKIIKSNKRVSMWFNKAYTYLKTCKDINDGIELMLNEITDESTYKQILDILLSDLNINNSKDYGNKRKFFGNAVCPTGIENFLDYYSENNSIIYIETLHNYRVDEIMNNVADNYLSAGYDVTLFCDSLNPEKVIHVLIDKLNIFYTSEKSIKYDIKYNFVGIIDKEQYKDVQNIISSDLTNIEKNIDIAVRFLKNAKDEHDILESYYIPNIDFTKIDKLKNEFINKYFN